MKNVLKYLMLPSLLALVLVQSNCRTTGSDSGVLDRRDPVSGFAYKYRVLDVVKLENGGDNGLLVKAESVRRQIGSIDHRQPIKNPGWIQIRPSKPGELSRLIRRCKQVLLAAIGENGLPFTIELNSPVGGSLSEREGLPVLEIQEAQIEKCSIGSDI